VYAQTFIPSAGNASGSASVNILFYRNADCTNFIPGAFQTGSVTARDSWMLLQGTATAPTETAGMLIRLGLTKSKGDMSLQAKFDNVLVAPSP
jgi:hypothetical protein